jgi:lactoylglutathione lyase
MNSKLTIISLIILCVAVGIVKNASAQDGVKTNHIALYVKDLAKSAAFYKNVMELKEIPEPFHDGKHVWLRTGEHSQLHLIEGAAVITDHDINSHFTL